MLTNSQILNILLKVYPDIAKRESALHVKTINVQGAAETDMLLVSTPTFNADPFFSQLAAGDDWRAHMLSSSTIGLSQFGKVMMVGPTSGALANLKTLTVDDVSKPSVNAPGCSYSSIPYGSFSLNQLPGFSQSLVERLESVCAPLSYATSHNGYFDCSPLSSTIPDTGLLYNEAAASSLDDSNRISLKARLYSVLRDAMEASGFVMEFDELYLSWSPHPIYYEGDTSLGNSGFRFLLKQLKYMQQWDSYTPGLGRRDLMICLPSGKIIRCFAFTTRDCSYDDIIVINCGKYTPNVGYEKVRYINRGAVSKVLGTTSGSCPWTDLSLASMITRVQHSDGVEVSIAHNGGDVSYETFKLLFGIPANAWSLSGTLINKTSSELVTIDDISFIRSHVNMQAHSLNWLITREWYEDYYKTGFGVYTPRLSNIQANVLKSWDALDGDVYVLNKLSKTVDFKMGVSDLREAKAYAKARAKACQTNDFLTQTVKPGLTYGQLSEKELTYRDRLIWGDKKNNVVRLSYSLDQPKAVTYSTSSSDGVKLYYRETEGSKKVFDPNTEESKTLVCTDRYFNSLAVLNGVTWDDLDKTTVDEKTNFTDISDIQGLTTDPNGRVDKRIGFGSWLNDSVNGSVLQLTEEQRYRLHLMNVMYYDSMNSNFMKIFNSFASDKLMKKLTIA